MIGSYSYIYILDDSLGDNPPISNDLIELETGGEFITLEDNSGFIELE